ncbi:MAG: chromate transporter [Oscillospiraceae bacterium]|nr:chromate transporter [Oscillospiraceae bacterium]
MGKTFGREAVPLAQENPRQRRELWRLFTTFFKIGAFTFGGGYAMIPLIQRETVETRKWITDEDVLEIIAIAESTPGPIAINSATFVGSRVAGVPGALCATLGVILPSFVIILIVARVLDAFQHLRALRYAFFGIRAGVLALILKAFWNMYKKCPKGVVPYSIAAGAFLLAAILKVNVLLVILCCAAAGLITSALRARREEK